jgi:O-antigen/teichoic acid export membrane protein
LAAKYSSTNGSIRNRVFSGAVWSVLGFGSSQFIRLASNLILTRLLFPEIFGLMALVQVILQGLKMMSDVGISTSVIRDERGDDPKYLNTAWTLQIVRGLLIWFISVLAAYPMAVAYESTELLFLIPFVGSTVIFQGFTSPAVLTLKRHIELDKVLVWEISSQLITTAITVGAVWYSRSIWAIATGGVIGAFISCLLSYKLPYEHIPRISIDRLAARNMLFFGKWIFISSFVTLIINKGDVLVLGLFLSKTDLGVFAIAAIWSRMAYELLQKINQQVMTPLYAAMFRESKFSIKSKIAKTRVRLLVLVIPVILILFFGGQILIDTLYDARYQSAGWMLQVLAVGTIGSAITATSANALLSFGDSFGYMTFQVTSGILLVVCMLLGGSLYGVAGLIVGVSISKFMSYPILVGLLVRHEIWLPKVDGVAFGLSAAVIGAGYWYGGGFLPHTSMQ